MNAHQIPAMMNPLQWIELRPEVVVAIELGAYKHPRRYVALNDDGSVAWWSAQAQQGRWLVEQQRLGDPLFRQACPRLCAPREGLWRTSSHCG